MAVNHLNRINKRAHQSLALWAASCAAHVLPHFQIHRPNDPRPHNAIKAGRSWARGKMTMSQARAASFASHAAARAAQTPAAKLAARSAGHAAATAHVVSHAPHAATYAAKAATNTSKERAWQFHRLPKHLAPFVFPKKSQKRITRFP